MHNAQRGLPAELSDDALAVLVCDHMGWTYQEYLDQPVSFIHGLLTLWRARGKMK